MDTFSIYILKNSPEIHDIQIWTIVDIRDFLQSAKRLDYAVAGASLHVEPVTSTILPNGDTLHLGESLELSFSTTKLSEEEYLFLRSIVDDTIDVIYYDENKKSIVYGARGLKKVKPTFDIISNEPNLVHIAGVSTKPDSLIFNEIAMAGSFVHFPQHGSVFNAEINIVTGVAI